MKTIIYSIGFSLVYAVSTGIIRTTPFRSIPRNVVTNMS